ncbi:hypothetical protein N1851_004874 [Merluccius polli]|uniref:Uncharacterized protein n=1 Tax=Merluccius polli TaxID=89951 RepID=A0AA47N8D2_MERPO|nr:hypothetical protein N1851_004874 [Merluccius polli]
MRRYLQPTQVVQVVLEELDYLCYLVWHIHTCVSRAGGDTRRPAVTQGELDRVVEGHQHNSRTGICSFVREGTGGALPEPYKMTSSRLLVYLCLTKLSETDSCLTSSSGTCAHCPAPCSSIAIRERTPSVKRTLASYESRFTLSTCDRRERVWRRRGERNAACNIIQHDRFGGGSVMVWGGISLEGHTDLHVIANGTLTPVRYRDEIPIE